MSNQQCFMSQLYQSCLRHTSRQNEITNFQLQYHIPPKILHFETNPIPQLHTQFPQGNYGTVHVHRCWISPPPRCLSKLHHSTPNKHIDALRTELLSFEPQCSLYHQLSSQKLPNWSVINQITPPLTKILFQT